MHDRTQALIEIFASISSPEFANLSHDGSKIAYSLHVGGHSQIFMLPTGYPACPQRLTATLDDCTSPQWSPDGSRLAFVRNRAIWTMSADGTNAQMLADHPAGNSEPRWSPDGSRIAFLSRRRGWDQVWTIDPKGGRPELIAAGPFDRDDLSWSPDGQSLVYCCIQENDLTTRGIYMIPSASGAEMLISPRNSWSGAPHFSPDGRKIAYLSDQDGWFHVYAYDCTSGRTKQLTHGDFEDGGPFFYNVDRFSGPCFSPDGTQIAIVRHREGNFDVWVGETENYHMRRISREDGHYRVIDWLPDGQHLVVAYDRTARPPDLHILDLDGEMRPLTSSGVTELSSSRMIVPEWITYPARDGLSIHAALFRPSVDFNLEETRDRVQARLPAILFLHGGPSFQFAAYYYPLPELLVQEGFVVLAPNFRGSTGYGRSFREGNIGEWGQADARDVLDGAHWLQRQPFVDPRRIAVMGPSYGGYLTLAALTLEPELFCAAVDLYGDSEIAESYWHGDRYGRMDLRRHMGTPDENPGGYHRGSPFYLAERIDAPLLILHGKEDRLVVPLMSEKMIEALRIENKYFEAHFYEGEEHGFAKPETRQDAWTRILNFLNRHCRDQ